MTTILNKFTRNNTLKLFVKITHSYISLFILIMWLIFNFNIWTFISIEYSNHLYNLVKKLSFVSVFINYACFLLYKNYLKALLVASFIAVGLIVYKTMGNNLIISNVLICIAISNLNAKKIVAVFLITIGLLFCTTLLLNLLELNDKTFIGFRDVDFRYSFGFGHANCIGAMLFFYMLTLWSFLKTKLSYLYCFTLFICSYIFLIKYVDSRTAELCFVLSILILSVCLIYDFMIERIEKSNASESIEYTDFSEIHNYLFTKLLRIACLIGFPIIAFCFVYVSYIYDPQQPLLEAVNRLFSTRIQLSHDAIVKYGFTPFGKILTQTDLDPSGLNAAVTTAYEYLDSFYINLTLNYGLTSLYVYTISYLIVIYKSFHFNHYRFAIALFIFSIYAIMEHVFISICFNVLIYLVFADFKNYSMAKLPKRLTSHFNICR